jgi:hypothetical protein
MCFVQRKARGGSSVLRAVFVWLLSVSTAAARRSDPCHPPHGAWCAITGALHGHLVSVLRLRFADVVANDHDSGHRRWVPLSHAAVCIPTQSLGTYCEITYGDVIVAVRLRVEDAFSAAFRGFVLFIPACARHRWTEHWCSCFRAWGIRHASPSRRRSRPRC